MASEKTSTVGVDPSQFDGPGWKKENVPLASISRLTFSVASARTCVKNRGSCSLSTGTLHSSAYSKVLMVECPARPPAPEYSLLNTFCSIR